MASGLSRRVLTAVLFGAPFLFMLIYSDVTRFILLIILILASAVEYNKLHYKNFNHPLAIISVLLSSGLTIACYYHPQYFPVLLHTAVAINILFIADLYLFKSSLHSKAPFISSILFTSLPYLVLITYANHHDLKLVFLSVMLMIWISDSAAYFVGKSVGKRKLMPSISPGKTKEGFLGAGMITVLSSYIFFSVLGVFSFQLWAMIALAVWIFGTLGDLAESKMKRHLKIKDSGSILPGHGGILDRFDSFSFCIPFILLIIEASSQ